MWWKLRWKLILTLIVPIILIPLLVLDDGDGTKKFKCLYVILMMGIYWMTEAMPLGITALLPVGLFPLLGILSTNKVVPNYMRDTGMMFIGGISLALGIEYSGLHKRIALNLMLLVGISPWRILLGIMTTTFLLSGWIVGNTAVTAMMIPIVIGLADTVEDLETRKKLKVLYMLAVGYAANIGGTAVMIGSIPNLIYRDLMAEQNVGQGGKYTDINFATWLAFNAPAAFINLIIVWGFLGFLYLRKRSPRKQSARVNENCLPQPNLSETCSTRSFEIAEPPTQDDDATAADEIGKALKAKLKEMGVMTFHETAVSVLFAIAILLWFTRDPQIFKGWQNLMFPNGDIIVADSTVAILVLVLMFIIPKEISKKRTGTLLGWEYLVSHFPWGVVLLVGGGFAISDGAEISGLSAWIGETLNQLENLPRPVLLLLILLILSLFTEIASNAATVSLLTPVLVSLSKRLNLHPLYISLPGAIACQYAFIFPTSNPPNALVFSAGQMQMLDMVRPGLFLNFICLLILYVNTITWGSFLFSFGNYEYAHDVNGTSII